MKLADRMSRIGIESAFDVLLRARALEAQGLKVTVVARGETFARLLVADPEAGPACAALADRRFGKWAKEAWPPLSDAVLAELR